MVERVAIDQIGRQGDGVAHGDTGPLYVSFALPGEVVEVEPWPDQPDRRKLIRILHASPERIEPMCPHFGTCGGCAIQHWREERYRAWKRRLVADALRDIAHGPGNPHAENLVGEIIDAHGEGRRRVVLHGRASADRDGVQIGFSAPHAHRVVAIDRCPVLAPGLDGAIEAAGAITEILRGAGKPLDIQATATDAGIDVDVRGSGPLSPQMSAALARIALSHRLARITRHGELVAQRALPTVRIGRAEVALPPGSFLQATACGEETLARLVLIHVGPARSVADLFAGIGPLTLRLAERARVFAADNNENAVDALRRAAAATAGLKPVEAVRRDLYRQPMTAPELSKLDAVVFDPPRQGAEAQVRELARSKVATVVGVSCNPTTFARDAKILVEGGYRLVSVTPIDQFRYSAHVEIVGRFER